MANKFIFSMLVFAHAFRHRGSVAPAATARYASAPKIPSGYQAFGASVVASRHCAKTRHFSSTLLLLLGIATRFIPHPFNFAGLGAMFLFLGYWNGRKEFLLFSIPVMLIQDWYLGFYEAPVMACVYGSYFLIYLFGRFVPKNFELSHVVICSAASSLLFFLTTNAAVWLFTAYYPKDISGLGLSYYYGLPFWRNSMLGDLMYGIIIFEAYKLYSYVHARRRFKKFAHSKPADPY